MRPAALEDPAWAVKVDALIDELAATGGPFTADDLHTPDTVNAPHPNAWGPLLAAAAHQGRITRTGASRKSTRGPRRGSYLCIWTGTQPAEGTAA